MRIRGIDKHNRTEFLRLYEIFTDAYRVEAKLLNVPADLFFPLRLTVKDLEESDDEISVSEIDGVLVGAIFLEKSEASITISNLVVDPRYFRRGIGNALVAYVLQQYPGVNFLVGTGAKNIPAIKLYEKFSFRAIGEETVEPDMKIVKLERIAARFCVTSN